MDGAFYRDATTPKDIYRRYKHRRLQREKGCQRSFGSDSWKKLGGSPCGVFFVRAWCSPSLRSNFFPGLVFCRSDYSNGQCPLLSQGYVLISPYSSLTGEPISWWNYFASISREKASWVFSILHMKACQSSRNFLAILLSGGVRWMIMVNLCNEQCFKF